MSRIFISLFLIFNCLYFTTVSAEEKDEKPPSNISKDDMEIIKIIEILLEMEIIENMDILNDMDILIEE